MEQLNEYVAQITGEMHAGFPEKNRERAQEGVRRTAQALQAGHAYGTDVDAWRDGEIGREEIQERAKTMAEGLVIGAKGLVSLEGMALNYLDRRNEAAAGTSARANDREHRFEGKKGIVDRIMSQAADDYSQAVTLAEYGEDELRDTFGVTPVAAAEAYCQQEGLMTERDGDEVTYVAAARDIAQDFDI